MKAFERLTKKIMNCILTIALVLTTGITSVFAGDISIEEQLVQNLTNLENTVNAIDINTINESIKGNVDTVLNSLKTINNNGITVKLDEENTSYTLKRNESVIVIDPVVDEEITKEKLMTSAQNVTTEYVNVISGINDANSKITEAYNQNQDIDITEQVNQINSTLIKINEIINSTDSDTTKVGELVTNISYLSIYSGGIENKVLVDKFTKLKNDIEVLSNEYPSDGVQSLLSSIEDAINGGLMSDDQYNTFLEAYNNEFVDNIVNQIITSDDTTTLTEKITNLDDNKKQILDSKISTKVSEYGIPQSEEERTSKLAELEKYNSYIDNYSTDTQESLKSKIELYNKSSLADLKSLNVHGFEFTKENIDNNSMELSVANERESVDVSAEVSDKASYVVEGNENLQVGENVITITVTAENTYAKKYLVKITRLEKYVGVGDATDAANTTNSNQSNKDSNNIQTLENNNADSSAQQLDNNEDARISYKTTTKKKANSTSESEEKKEQEKEKSNTSDSNEKYDKEIEEDENNPLTIVLIIAGIALVGFGIYMLFGKDDDDEDDIKSEIPKKEEKVEIKKVEIKDNKSSEKKSTNNKSTTQAKKTTSKKSNNKNTKKKK